MDALLQINAIIIAENMLKKPDLAEEYKRMQENPENNIDVGQPQENLHRKTLKGGGWIFLLRTSRLILEAIKLVVLARLLTENDFGLMGLALLMASMIETFTATGFDFALIQRKEIDRQFLDSAWTVTVLRGVMLFAAMFFAAPWAGQFFKTPQATPIIQAYGLVVLLRGLANIGVIHFRKELEFNKQFVYQFSGMLVDVSLAILIACIYRTVWALVLGALAGETVRCIASYIVHPYRPRFRFNRQKTAQLFHFGKWVLGSQILGYFLAQGDDILVGRVLGVAALGFYQMAYKLSNMPATEISSVIAQVSFPAYSKLQHDPTLLGQAYLRILHLTALITIPIAGIIFILSGEFVGLFLGERWLAIVPAIKILALYGMFGSIGGTTGVVFMAMGRPHLGTRIKTGQLILLAILIYPLTSRWGIVGTSVAVTIEAAVIVPVAVWVVLKILRFGVKKPVKLLVLPLAASLAMIAIVYTLKIYVFLSIGFFSFFILAIIAIVSYALTVILCDKLFAWGTGDLLREQISVLRNSEMKRG